MSATEEMTPTAHLAALKEAPEAGAFQKLVTGMEYDDSDEAYEALVEQAEEAGDDEEFPEAAKAFRDLSVLAWVRSDNRMMENFAIQALYYGTIVGFDTLLGNFTAVWAMWAHVLPTLKPGDRARLQNFARFGRSFQLGLRKREETDDRVNAAVTLLAPTFESLGELNLKKIADRKVDITADTATLWDEVNKLLAQIETSTT
ncbi:MAG: hypothetical protein ACE5FI_12995 [Anaerolineales bacterium]